MSGRPGDDLLSRALRQSTIGATGFHGRVRNGIEWGTCAITTWSSRHMKCERRAITAVGSAKKRRHPKPLGSPVGQPYPALYSKVVYLVFACKIPQHKDIPTSICLYVRLIKPIERLVPISFTHYCASTLGLSTWWSSTVLKRILVLRGASHLDAFSGYPFHT